MFFTNVFLHNEMPRSDNGTNHLRIHVPYVKITSSLVLLTISSLAGLLVRRFRPKVAKRIAGVIRVIAVVFILYVIIIGTVAYYEIFKDLNWRIVLSSMLLPWIGYLLGALASILTGRSKQENIAITLETGIQNTGVAIFISRETLNSFEYSKAIVAPVFYAISTPILVIVCFSIRMVLEKIRNNREIKKKNASCMPPIQEPEILQTD